MTPAPDDVRAAELAVIEAARRVSTWTSRNDPLTWNECLSFLHESVYALDRARSSASEPSVEAGITEQRVREIASQQITLSIGALFMDGGRGQEIEFRLDNAEHNSGQIDRSAKAIEELERRLDALKADVLDKWNCHELAIWKSAAPADYDLERGLVARIAALEAAAAKREHELTDLFARFDGAHTSGLRERIEALEASAAKKGETMCVRCGKGPPPVGGNVHGQCEPASAPPPASATPTAEDWKQYSIYQKTEWDGSRNVPCAVFSVSYVEKMLRDCESAARERAIEECAKIVLCSRSPTFMDPKPFTVRLAESIRALLAPEKEAK